ncbi:hypothetical protein GCM10022215_18270 [Nocardioides fonticola]|uniref:VRR-NUC domain-containing protein n=1 Tax=Nocardioides fonticola TaxID=450363 RepID=A0ABP7XHW6_9ACTN
MTPLPDVTRASIAPLPTDLSESVFLARVVSLCKLERLPYYHTHDSRRSVAGFPDLAILGPRELVVAELKTNKGRTTPEQRAWLTGLEAAGIRAFLWRPADWLEINEVLHDLAHPSAAEGGAPVSVTIRHTPTVHRTASLTSAETECCWRPVRALPIGDTVTLSPGLVTCRDTTGTGPASTATTRRRTTGARTTEPPEPLVF